MWLLSLKPQHTVCVYYLWNSWILINSLPYQTQLSNAFVMHLFSPDFHLFCLLTINKINRKNVYPSLTIPSHFESKRKKKEEILRLQMKCFEESWRIGKPFDIFDFQNLSPNSTGRGNYSIFVECEYSTSSVWFTPTFFSVVWRINA